MPPHPLTNFAREKYYQNRPTFNDVYSRNNLPKIKCGSIGTHLIALYVNGSNIIYFDSFGIEHIPNEIKNN